MKHSVIARLAGVHRSAVTNYFAAKKDPERKRYVTPETEREIESVLSLSQCEVVEIILLSGATIGPVEAAQDYHIGRLAARIDYLRDKGRVITNLSGLGKGRTAKYMMIDNTILEPK
jgi:hypothetical protein